LAKSERSECRVVSVFVGLMSGSFNAFETLTLVQFLQVRKYGIDMLFDSDFPPCFN
jgi:hypothetical protein